MGDFSIKALTAPFVPPVQRYFGKITNFIISKNPKLDRDQVDHDVKVIWFNAITGLMASVISSAYFRRIALVTAVTLVILFYLVRRVIDATFHPPKPPSETSTVMQQVLAVGRAFSPIKRGVQIQVIPQPKSLKEKFQEFFRQDDAIVIGNVALLKLTHYPMMTDDGMEPTIIGMFLTRTP